MRPKSLVIYLVAALLATVIGAQQPPEAQFEDLIEVTEVLLDVLVTDRKGDVVTGLGKDDFVVKEGGREVEVTSVTFYATGYGLLESLDPVAAGDGSAAVDSVPWSRHFILFFDNVIRTAGGSALSSRILSQQLEAGREVSKWVRGEMLPSDWVAVVGWDAKMRVYLDFSQDREAIVGAVDAATRGLDPGVIKPSDRRRAERRPFSLWRGLPQTIEIERQTRRQYDALRLLADATRGIVGRKNLLLFSLGFGDPSSFSAQPDRRYYPQMEQALNDANVAIHPIDLVPIDVQHAQAPFLSLLAGDTGGTYYANRFTTFATPLRQISEANAGYYLLSYQAQHPAREDGFQRVKVKLRSGKYRVRARKGYAY